MYGGARVTPMRVQPAIGLGFFAGLLMMGCADVVKQPVDLDPDVAFVALLEMDDRGEVRRASSLLPWTDALAVVARSDRPTTVIGYSAAELAPFGVQVGAAPAGALAPARQCLPRLPAPAVAFEWSDGVWREVAPDTVPPVTASFVEQACPDPLNFDWGVDDRCGESPHCARNIRRLSPCVAELDLQACGGGRVLVSVGPDRRLCAQPVARTPACREVTASTDEVRFACVDCSLDIHRRAADVPAPFSVRSVTFDARPMVEPPTEKSSDEVRASVLRFGYGQAMTLVDDRVVIASDFGDGATCTSTAPTFVFIDASTLAMQRRPAKPCTRNLAAAPTGFWGVHREPNRRWHISRFDRSGLVQQTRPLAEAPYDSEDWEPDGLWMTPDGGRLVVVMLAERSDSVPGTVVAIHSSEDLQRQVVVPIARSVRASANVLVDEVVALTSFEDRKVLWVPVGATTPSHAQDVLLDSVRVDLFRPWPLGSDRIVFGADGAASAIGADRFASALTRISHFGRPALQATLTFGTWDTDVLLALGTRRDSDGRKALAMLLDAAEERYRPGVWIIGRGIPTDAVRWRDRHFVLLPWVGEVAVLDRVP